MGMDPFISLIIMVMLIVVIYSLGLWAGRNLERHLEADKIKEAKRLAEAKKNARRKLR